MLADTSPVSVPADTSPVPSILQERDTDDGGALESNRGEVEQRGADDDDGDLVEHPSGESEPQLENGACVCLFCVGDLLLSHVESFSIFRNSSEPIVSSEPIFYHPRKSDDRVVSVSVYWSALDQISEGLLYGQRACV